MYLDSAILVKLIVRETDTPFFVELVDGEADIWSSELVLTECWSALCRLEREGRIDDHGRRQAWKRFEALMQAGGLHLQPVTHVILRLANRMLAACHDAVPLRTLDAIHLASCEFLGANPLQTTDRTMRLAATSLGIPLGPLP